MVLKLKVRKLSQSNMLENTNILFSQALAKYCHSLQRKLEKEGPSCSTASRMRTVLEFLPAHLEYFQFNRKRERLCFRCLCSSSFYKSFFSVCPRMESQYSMDFCMSIYQVCALFLSDLIFAVAFMALYSFQDYILTPYRIYKLQKAIYDYS